MNRGVYLEEFVESTPTDFCIGVAAYPEKHVEAPNLERDIALCSRSNAPARTTP